MKGAARAEAAYSRPLFLSIAYAETVAGAAAEGRHAERERERAMSGGRLIKDEEK